MCLQSNFPTHNLTLIQALKIIFYLPYCHLILSLFLCVKSSPTTQFTSLSLSLVMIFARERKREQMRDALSIINCQLEWNKFQNNPHSQFTARKYDVNLLISPLMSLQFVTSTSDNVKRSTTL